MQALSSLFWFHFFAEGLFGQIIGCIYLWACDLPTEGFDLWGILKVGKGYKIVAFESKKQSLSQTQYRLKDYATFRQSLKRYSLYLEIACRVDV